jgi:hypothetical protein
MDETYINDESGIKRRPEDQAGTLQQTKMRSVTIKPRQMLVSRKKRKSSCGAQDFLRHKTASSFVLRRKRSIVDFNLQIQQKSRH